MNVEVITVRIGGGFESVKNLLSGLPGDHQPESVGGDLYRVVTTNAGFLKYAIVNQGYGDVLEGL